MFKDENVKIEEMRDYLSKSTLNMLLRNRIETVADLSIAYKENKLCKIKGFGCVREGEVARFLDMFYEQLKKETAPKRLKITLGEFLEMVGSTQCVQITRLDKNVCPVAVTSVAELCDSCCNAYDYKDSYVAGVQSGIANDGEDYLNITIYDDEYLDEIF